MGEVILVDSREDTAEPINNKTLTFTCSVGTFAKWAKSLQEKQQL